MNSAKGRRFIRPSWELYGNQQARLHNKRLREGYGVVGSTPGLVTYVFSRQRCKPTACRLAEATCIGADVAGRRARDEQQYTMSDISTTTTIGEQPDEQLRTTRTRQSVPDVMGGGGQCQGGTPDTPPSTNPRERGSTGRTVVKFLLCQGCQGSSRNYRVVRTHAPAPTRSNDGLVWTPDTPDTVFRCSNTPTSRSLPSGRVSAPPNPPTHDIRIPLPLSPVLPPRRGWAAMTHAAECPRCGRTFAPDTRHIRAEYSWYPPESRADSIGEIADFCPDCSVDFETFVENGGEDGV